MLNQVLNKLLWIVVKYNSLLLYGIHKCQLFLEGKLLININKESLFKIGYKDPPYQNYSIYYPQYLFLVPIFVKWLKTSQVRQMYHTITTVSVDS